MKQKNEQIKEAQIVEEKALTIQEPQSLAKPENDTKFAHEAAKLLVDIIEKNKWSRRLGGQSAHIQYEGWQTAGKYYGLAVKTFDSEYVEMGDTWGFKAKATVVNEITGVQVGGAEAYCMSDEPNWRNKPKFQLASMAQTRAGSKALRQNLGFVIALAGYNPTPAEEMEGVHSAQPATNRPVQDTGDYTREPYVNGSEATTAPVVQLKTSYPLSKKQADMIASLLSQKGKTDEELKNALTVFHKTKVDELTSQEASTLIKKLLSLPNPIEDSTQDALDLDAIDEDITEMKGARYN